MNRLFLPALLIGLISTGTAALAVTSSKHLPFLFKTEHAARARCPNDRIVWANTATHTLHVHGDHHFGHTQGGFACKSAARARGFRGPSAHA